MGVKMKSVFVLLLMSSIAQAQTIEIGEVQSAGTGCPNGSVAVHENPFGPQRLLVINGMKAQSGGSTGKRFDRKNCSIAIPIKVPAGYSVALKGLADGSQRTEMSAQSSLTQEFFVAGGVGTRVTKQFRPGTGTRFRQSSPVLEWTPCGSDSILRANLALLTQGSARVQLDAVLLDVQYRQCR